MTFSNLWRKNHYERNQKNPWWSEVLSEWTVGSLNSDTASNLSICTRSEGICSYCLREKQKSLVLFGEDMTIGQKYILCFQFIEACSFPRLKLLPFYFCSLCLNWDPHSLLLNFNNLRVTWRAFIWETFQAKPRQQFRERFLFVDKNILKQPRELLLFHIIIFNVSLDMYEMPFSSCGRITFLHFAAWLLLNFYAAFPLSNIHPKRLYKHEQYL